MRIVWLDGVTKTEINQCYVVKTLTKFRNSAQQDQEYAIWNYFYFKSRFICYPKQQHVLLYKPLYSHLIQGLVIYIVSLGCDCDANALWISYWPIFFSCWLFSLLALTHLWSIWSSAALRPPESFPFVFIFWQCSYIVRVIAWANI